jgi:hypothetical protein
MSVIVRSTRGEKLIRRGRGRRASVAAARSGQPAGPPVRERRDVDPMQDTAIYNCGCGMVFEAPVCTSVGCPHCGADQAW